MWVIRNRWKPKPEGPEKHLETTPNEMQATRKKMEALADKAKQANPERLMATC
jgi:hypothetical protein